MAFLFSFPDLPGALTTLVTPTPYPEHMKFLKYLLAFVFGAFAGFFLYLELTMIFFTEPPGWWIFLSFFGGWALSTHWVVRNTGGIAEMMSRSFLLSAILSFGFTPASLILSAKSVSVDGSGAEVAGSLIGGGLAGSLGVMVSLTFTFFSMVGFGLVKLYRREDSRTAGGLVECMFCAEPIKETAKKCRHCGEFLDKGSLK